MNGIGKFLIIFGVIILILGLLITYTNLDKYMGKLPGDINIKKGNTSFHFPIATCIIISIILTIILNLLLRK